ncbi:4Fe-4S binding protein [Geoglobus acetivorans]|uniref:Formylmethanofuran dehydrogenase subunit F n=1 Tax=Geoglobus acetivorans TaxID=565033 RepID=A0A0A7GGG2_GEOAI|nr:formylmethanofuran dehydrogenase subunit F [Geoglobus acetivorans]
MVDVERDIDMAGETKFRYIQRAGDEVRELVYDYKICNGCGICVYACPVNAIELGPVHDIAIGLEMPPVTIDHTKCAYCGICYAFCPFSAYEFYVNGEKVGKEDLPLSPVGFTEIDCEKCVDCTLCYRVCPEDAITREVKITRDAIQQKNEDVRGKVVIDREKCNLCGICAEFCQVFKMVEREPGPTNPMPYEDILLDESTCDYCVLCEDVCPEGAIKVDGGKRIEFRLEKLANISVDNERCSNCAYCEVVCPYDAIKTTKPMEGELFLYEPRMYRCDPVGCGACIKICQHNRVWYVSEDKGRVHFNEDHCIYCGACENACPYDLIGVRRESYYTKEKVSWEPWVESWHQALSRIIEKRRTTEPERKLYREEMGGIIAEEEIIVRKVDERVRAELEEKLRVVEALLKRPYYRRVIEKGNTEAFINGLRKELSEG